MRDEQEVFLTSVRRQSQIEIWMCQMKIELVAGVFQKNRLGNLTPIDSAFEVPFPRNKTALVQQNERSRCTVGCSKTLFL